MVNGRKTNNEEGADGSRDAGKGAGVNAGQGRDTRRGDDGSEIIRQQLKQIAAQKFPGDRARIANFMKEASKAMDRAEKEGMVPKPQGRERPQEREASRSRDDDKNR